MAHLAQYFEILKDVMREGNGLLDMACSNIIHAYMNDNKVVANKHILTLYELHKGMNTHKHR